MNILRVRQAAAREDRIAFKLSGRLATSAPAPTCCAHGRAHAQRMRNAVSRSPMCKREQSNGGENTAVPFLVFIFLPRNCGQPSRTLYPSALLSRAYFLVFPFSPSLPPPPLFSTVSSLGIRNRAHNLPYEIILALDRSFSNHPVRTSIYINSLKLQ